MNATEKIVFEKIVKSLKESQLTSWDSSSDRSDWVELAKRMSHSIDNSVNIIEGLLTLPTENE